MRHCCAAPLNPNLTLTEIESHLVKMRVAAFVVSPGFEEAKELALGMGVSVLTPTPGDSIIQWQLDKSANPQTPIGQNDGWNAAVVLNTSATTGQSKLVPLTHSNLYAMFENTRTALVLTDADRLLLVTPTYHAQGLVSSFAQFLAGGVVLATRGFEAASYPGWLRDHSPTWYTAAPAIHQAVATIFENHPIKNSSLRFVRSSGAAFTVELRRDLQRALGVPVLNGYGMSETGAVCSDALNLKPYKPGSVGRSVGPKIAILSPDGRFLPPGQQGEVVISGPSVMLGYANNPAANQAAFHNGWFRTGDLGRLDADGFLFVTGRSKEMINRGGQKIVPEEVDSVLLAHPAVREAVAFAVPHPTLGEDIACAVIPREDAPTSEAELRLFAGRKLAPFKVPRRVYFVTSIPRGDTGKPKRHLLAQQVQERASERRQAITLAPSPSVSPDSLLNSLPDPENDPLLGRLIEIWSRVLKRDDVDLRDDFFTAGGDSLGAVNLLTEVDLRFGTDLQGLAANFIDNPTLAGLYHLLRTTPHSTAVESASSEIEIFPVRDAGGKAALFCIPGNGDEGLYFRRLASYLQDQLPLTVVRPANTWYSHTLSTFEDSANRIAAAIQSAQPEGPYLIAGYSYGGIVAFATAQQLLAQGHSVRLVLFDVTMPGHPSLVRGLSIYLKRAFSELRELQRGSGIANAGVNSRRMMRRILWFALRPLLEHLPAAERNSAMQFLIAQAQQGYLPFYRPRTLQAPILHFLSREENRPIRGTARFGWRRLAAQGISEVYLEQNHSRHFRESNLGSMAETLLAWCLPETAKSESEAAEQELLSA
jgi:acyl-CoA synthetase (AMP-forming)/AMP-acid ligase II/thioesterase domain-containing protein